MVYEDASAASAAIEWFNGKFVCECFVGYVVSGHECTMCV